MAVDVNLTDGAESVAEIRAFLTGTLPDERLELLEYSLLSDEALYELLLATEDELIDEYLRGTLSAAEATSFLEYLGRLPGGIGRIELAKALQERWSAEDSPRSPRSWLESAVEPVYALLRWPAPVWAAAAALVGVGLALYASMSATHDAPLLLAPGLTRGESVLPTARLSDVDESLPVLLEIGAFTHDRYRATLFDSDTRPIFTSGGLRAEETGERILVTFSVPARLLDRGDYSIALDGESQPGTFDPVGRYVFRLTE